MRFKVNLSSVQRTLIVAALKEYEADTLARDIASTPLYDPTDDGPEVRILRPAGLDDGD